MQEEEKQDQQKEEDQQEKSSSESTISDTDSGLHKGIFGDSKKDPDIINNIYKFEGSDRWFCYQSFSSFEICASLERNFQL